MNAEEFDANFETSTHDNLSFATYLRVEALSNSGVEDLKKSPAHYQYYKRNPRQPTEAMEFGTLVHCAILERDELAKRFIAKPEGYDGRTKEGKGFKEECIKKGLSVVDPENLLSATNIADRITSLAEGNLAAIIAASKKEFSVFWKRGDIKCKGRPDLYCDQAGGIAIDVKTTRSPLRDGFEREVWNRGFHRKAAWYREGLKANGLPCKHVMFIAIDNNEGPKDFMTYLMRPEIVDLGDKQNNMLLKLFEQCQKDDMWPGYPKEIQELGIPNWTLSTLSEEELS